MERANLAEDRSAIWHLLGGVRFGLAALVMVGHLAYFEKVPTFLKHLSQCSPCTAVFCFLVISGYSIAHSIDRGEAGFYRRRLARIYPLYLLSIITSVGVAFLPGSTHAVPAHNLLANLLFLQTFCAVPLICNQVVWSLGVEVGFYALAPVFRRLQTGMLIALAVLSAVAFVHFPYEGLGYYAFLPHGASMLFLGWLWLAGFVYYRHRDSQLAGLVLICSVICLTSLNSLFTGSLQHITVVLSLGVLVGGRAIVVVPWLKNLLGYLGNLSFPLYLVHVPIFFLCIETLHWHSPVVLMPLAIAAAAICVVVEPGLRNLLIQMLDLPKPIEARIAAYCRSVAHAMLPNLLESAPIPRFAFNGVRSMLRPMMRPISIMIAPLTYAAFVVSAQNKHTPDLVNVTVPTAVRQQI
jgi:peptidoglycan/LPS O-acetylase OafA/YrhL